MTSVFLSYSSCDKELARRIAVDLSMSDVRVWFDSWNIHVGHSITQEISRGLEEADLVVVLLSEHSVQSGWVEKEWMSCIGTEADSRGVLILPVLISNCEVPSMLRDKRRADVREDYDAGLKELIAGVHVHAAKGRSVTAGAVIRSGRIVYERTTPNTPNMHGVINAIERGCFERWEGGLRAHIHVVASHQSLQDLSQKLGIDRMSLTSTDYSISIDDSRPSVFECHQALSLRRGEILTDFRSGRSGPLPCDVTGSTDTTVACAATGPVLAGAFSLSTVFRGVSIGTVSIKVDGSFKAEVSM